MRQALGRGNRAAGRRFPQLGPVIPRAEASRGLKTEPDSLQELTARALRHLARREHSRDELARKLFPYAATAAILEGLLRELESKKQLSNERFAEIRARGLARKYGAARIRHDLRGKGVSEELAERAVKELDELHKARQILARKYPDAASTRHERARRARFLQSRGFSHDTIRRALALSSSTNFSEE